MSDLAITANPIAAAPANLMPRTAAPDSSSGAAASGSATGPAAPDATDGATAADGTATANTAASKDDSKDSAQTAAPAFAKALQNAQQAAQAPAAAPQAKTKDDDPAGDAAASAQTLAALLPLMQSAAAKATAAAPVTARSAEAQAKDDGPKAEVQGVIAAAMPAAVQPIVVTAQAGQGAPGNAGEPLALSSLETKMAAMSAALPAQIGAAAADDGRHADSAATPESQFDAMIASAQAVLPQSSATHAQAPTELKVDTPVGAKGWDNDVGDKLRWMVGQDQQHADLVLHPPQLGRIEVSLSVNGDQASATFSSANPVVRDALEAALPRLREVLADAGINLGQAQVGGEASNQAANKQAENRDNSRSAWNASVQNVGSIGMGMTTPRLRQGNGLVDVFA